MFLTYDLLPITYYLFVAVEDLSIEDSCAHISGWQLFREQRGLKSDAMPLVVHKVCEEDCAFSFLFTQQQFYSLAHHDTGNKGGSKRRIPQKLFDSLLLCPIEIAQ